MRIGLLASLPLLPLAAACSASPPPNPPPAPSALPAATSIAETRPADVTSRYDVILGDHVAGKSVIVRHADGSIDEDYAFDDRGRGPKTHARLELDGAGMPRRFELSGNDYLKRSVREVATCDGSGCKWDSNDEHGSGGLGFYVPLNWTYTIDGPQLAAALKSPDGVRLLPGGTFRARKAGEATVSHAGEARHVNVYELSGIGFYPSFEWFEDDGAVFGALDDWGSTVREGWAEVVPKLLEIQRPLGQGWRERVFHGVSHAAESLAITHARLFDPATRKVTEDATIVIEGGKVKAVGARIPAPPGAEVVSAQGRTVLPGLWDMHVHAGDFDGLVHLSQGITTARDLGTDMGSALQRRARWDESEDAGPHLLLAGFVDGRGPFQAPTKVFADTPEEAKAVVDRYAASGYPQLKIYSSVKPELVPVLVKEAHAKGMRVSGHVPAHMIAEDAVQAGYDEIQHLLFVMLDVLATRDEDTRGALRLTRIAEKGADLDLDGAPMRALLDLLAKKQTVIDPTVNNFDSMLTVRPDHADPSLAPILARLPPQVQRTAFTGALPVPEGRDAAHHAAFKKCLALVKRLWDRRITLVAGTDAWPGFSLHHELELYAEAGIPNADVLTIATLGAARVMKREKTSGSIAPGKDADLILVDGDPLADMRDIRNVVTVVKGGKVIDAVALQRSLSIAPRPRSP